MTRQRGALGEGQLAFNLRLDALDPLGVVGSYALRIFQAESPDGEAES